jgi:hypothetical protein
MNSRDIIILLALIYIVIGCSTTETFPVIARAGDTVALPIGMKTGITRSNLQVTFNNSTAYLPGEPASRPVVRAVVNLYPDPVSKLVVGDETNQDLGTYANLYGGALENTIANFDKEWWNTVVFLDLPDNLPTGTNTIDMVAGTQALNQANIEIINSNGAPNPFDTNEGGSLLPEMVMSMERAEHYTITFQNNSSSTVPYAIQVEFQHDTSTGGVPYIINPRGDIKNVSWSENNGDINVILIPTHSPLGRLIEFKFYIAGNIGGLQVISTQSYDINGKLTPDDIEANIAHGI